MIVRVDRFAACCLLAPAAAVASVAVVVLDDLGLMTGDRAVGCRWNAIRTTLGKVFAGQWQIDPSRN